MPSFPIPSFVFVIPSPSDPNLISQCKNRQIPVFILPLQGPLKILANCQICKVMLCNITAELKYHCSALLYSNYVIIVMFLINHVAVITHPLS